MCKGICTEKCNECVRMGVSCCRTLPVFSNEEAANLIDDIGYNKGTLKGLTLVEVHENVYAFVPSKMAAKSKNIVWNDKDCPFLDSNTGKCRIYKYRPKICKEYGYHDAMPCPFNEMTIDELKETDKAELKSMHIVTEKMRKKAVALAMNITNDSSSLFRHVGKRKRDFKVTRESLKYSIDDLILLTAWYYVNEAAKGDVNPSPTDMPKIFNTVAKKELILGKKNQVFVTTTYKITVAEDYKDHVGVKKFAELMNIIANIFSRFVQEKLTICVNAINAVSKGFDTKDDVLNAYVFAATLITRYLEEIKPKDNKYSGLITYDRLVEFSDLMDELEEDQISIDSMKIADKIFDGFVRYLK